jgi:hypothetical protein
MEPSTRRTVVAVALLLVNISGFPKNKKGSPSVPPAPLPKQIVTAQTVFLSKGQGSDPYLKGGAEYAFDLFYSDMKNWGKYRLVDSPAEADLIFELSYSSQRVGTRVWSTTNVYNGTTQVHSTPEMDPRVTFTVYDPKTCFSLWSAAGERDTARRRTNRQKNLTKTVHEIVGDFKSRVEGSGSN